MISPQVVDQVRQATEIVGLIGEYLPLKRVGDRYRALCPFHSERTPSFYISPKRQIYHCFGCGATGNAITFLMRYESLSFPEAVRRLAERAGIRVEFEPRDPELTPLYEANEFAAQFFTAQLEGPARQYLESRGLSRDVIERFRLGYAPGGNRLFGEARRRGWDPKTLEQAGLIEERDGGYRDRFWERVIFPIFSLSGRVIGFGGRVLDEARAPKYLNSPDTKLFKKGENLYGLYQAREKIVRSGGLVVEGYFDLLALHQNGFGNAVATLGTALTPAQGRLLRRFSEKAVILFDCDPAGLQAAHRALKVLLDANLDPRVALIDPGTDPDTFLMTKGPEEFSKLVSKAQDFVDFCYNHRRPQGVEEEADLISELLDYVSLIRDEVRRELWLKRIADRSGVSFGVLARRVSPRRELHLGKPERLLGLEEKIVLSALSGPELAEIARKELRLEDIQDEGLREILSQSYEGKEVADLMSWLPPATGERLAELFSKGVDRAYSPEELQSAIQEFKLRREGREGLKRIEGEVDDEGRRELLAQAQERARLRVERLRRKKEGSR